MTKNQKNYIILITISLLTIILLWYAVKWHNAYEEEYSNQNYIVRYVDEVRVEEFDSFIRDRRNVVIYFAKPADQKAYDFEKTIDDEIVKYSLREELYYMNVSVLDNVSILELINKYNSNISITSNNQKLTPSICIYKDAKLVKYLSGSDLNQKNLVNELTNYGFIHGFDE